MALKSYSDITLIVMPGLLYPKQIHIQTDTTLFIFLHPHSKTC